MKKTVGHLFGIILFVNVLLLLFFVICLPQDIDIAFAYYIEEVDETRWHLYTDSDFILDSDDTTIFDYETQLYNTTCYLKQNTIYDMALEIYDDDPIVKIIPRECFSNDRF